MPKALYICISCLLLLACEGGGLEERRLKEVADDLRQSVREAKHKLQELAPSKQEVSSATSEELSKLFIFEYKSFELDLSLADQELEERLNELGREMWECFAVLPFETKLKFFCKRRPKTYLRYVPRFFP